MSDDGFEPQCCGCCIGLAVGYFVLGGHAKISFADETPKVTLEQKVETAQIEEESDKGLLLKGIDYYQKEIGPRIKENLGRERLCKYEPTCSEYAKRAIEQHGPVTGSVMATARLARCNPLSEGGEDPVGTPWYAKKVF